MPRNLDDFELERTPHTPKDEPEAAGREKPLERDDALPGG
jgi:hypothetical protein